MINNLQLQNILKLALSRFLKTSFHSFYNVFLQIFEEFVSHCALQPVHCHVYSPPSFLSYCHRLFNKATQKEVRWRDGHSQHLQSLLAVFFFLLPAEW